MNWIVRYGGIETFAYVVIEKHSHHATNDEFHA